MFLAILFSKEAFTSDKGIKSEIVYASVDLFCSTDLLAEVKPIVDQAKDKKSVQPLWTDFKAKHKTELAGAEYTDRLANVPESYIKECSVDAWNEMKKKCPQKTKGMNANYLFWFLQHYILEPSESGQ